MENVTEAGSALAMDCYYEEYGVITEQAMKELIERVEKRGEPRKEIVHTIQTGDRDSSVWRDWTNNSLDFVQGFKYATSSVKELSFSIDLAAESAKTFIAAWRDGKWVPTGGRSSRQKKGVGGKRW